MVILAFFNGLFFCVFFSLAGEDDFFDEVPSTSILFEEETSFSELGFSVESCELAFLFVGEAGFEDDFAGELLALALANMETTEDVFFVSFLLEVKEGFLYTGASSISENLVCFASRTTLEL